MCTTMAPSIKGAPSYAPRADSYERLFERESLHYAFVEGSYDVSVNERTLERDEQGSVSLYCLFTHCFDSLPSFKT